MESRQNAPDVVFVPVIDRAAGQEPEIVLHTLGDGRIALYAYTDPQTLSRLHAGGESWASYTMTELQAAHRSRPYDLVILDADPAGPEPERDSSKVWHTPSAYQRELSQLAARAEALSAEIEQAEAKSRPKAGPVRIAGSILLILFCFSTWLAVALRAETLLGQVGAAVLLTLGAAMVFNTWSMILCSRAPRTVPEPQVVNLDGQPATYYARGERLPWLLGVGVFTVMGLWCVVMAVACVLAGQWAWAVLLAFPAAYLLASPVGATTGRFTPGGVWVTAGAVVDRQGGLETSLRFSEAYAVHVRSEALRVTGERNAAQSRALIRFGLRRKPDVPGVMTISARGLAQDQLLDDLRARVSGPASRPASSAAGDQ